MRQGLSALPILYHVQNTLVTRTKSKLATHWSQHSSSCHSHWAGHQAPKWPPPSPPEAPRKPMPFLSLSTNVTITAVRVKAPGPSTFKERICGSGGTLSHVSKWKQSSQSWRLHSWHLGGWGTRPDTSRLACSSEILFSTWNRIPKGLVAWSLSQVPMAHTS